MKRSISDGDDGGIDGNGYVGGGDEDDGECLPSLVGSGDAVGAQSNNRSLINHSLLFRPITCETDACQPKLQRSKMENTVIQLKNFYFA